jgi:hypothetical protein
MALLSFLHRQRRPLLWAIEEGDFPQAKILALSEKQVARASRVWPTTKAFEAFANASPENQDWLLSLPLDWSACDGQQNTLMHVVFSELGKNIKLLLSRNKNLEEELLEPVIRRLSRVFEFTVFDQPNQNGVVPNRMMYYRKGRGMVSAQWCKSLLEQRFLEESLSQNLTDGEPLLRKTNRL